jgi:hypothetical protein
LSDVEIVYSDINYTPAGTRRCGRPRETLRRTITRESANINVNTHDLQELAKDCRCWRYMISALCAASGSGGI